MGLPHLPLPLTRRPPATAARVAGVLAGLLAACSPALPPDVVAVVSGHAIPASRYFDALAARAVQQQRPVTAAHRNAVLDALVDEALLLERAAVTGVRDPRRALDAGAIPEPDEADLLAYYTDHLEAFARAPRLRVQAWRDGAPHPVPDGHLPFGALEQVIGPTAARAAAALAPGETGPPTPYASGTIVVRLVSRQPGSHPPFEDVRDAVRIAWIRDARADARVALLDDLRADAVIRINASVRDAPIPPLDR